METVLCLLFVSARFSSPITYSLSAYWNRSDVQEGKQSYSLSLIKSTLSHIDVVSRKNVATTLLPVTPPSAYRFLPLDAILALCMLSSCVHPSVRPSGIISKRLNVWSRNQCHMIAMESSFMTQKISTKFRWDQPPTGARGKCRLAG